MYLLICSPDKISIGMFMEFYRNHIEKGCPIGSLQYLISTEGIQKFIESFSSQYPESGIVSYYVKNKINITEPLSIIPKELVEWADVVLWFDLYATEMVSLKDTQHFMNINGNLWKRHIEKMG
jgi:hypothetical protein